jgi:hypothetical protein
MLKQSSRADGPSSQREMASTAAVLEVNGMLKALRRQQAREGRRVPHGTAGIARPVSMPRVARPSAATLPANLSRETELMNGGLFALP